MQGVEAGGLEVGDGVQRSGAGGVRRSCTVPAGRAGAERAPAAALFWRGGALHLQSPGVRLEHAQPLRQHLLPLRAECAVPGYEPRALRHGADWGEGATSISKCFVHFTVCIVFWNILHRVVYPHFCHNISPVYNSKRTVKKMLYWETEGKLRKKTRPVPPKCKQDPLW
ncbi:hypothetical protein SKAU_G00156370 [Synaphobranchus kaupii]|uniref:Uncharacterized protein n=1 Tax=Synaphobranchus kaupii TaxID=118154 RepID=A0A9Q1FI32_SYNKA|nr:hypothetical protein SKAU_G00156370 [Synaphobranchus kaupii]